MTEVEQLQLQNKCEQLELIVAHLNLINTYMITKLSSYQHAINIFKKWAAEKTKEDDSEDTKISLLLTFIETTKEKLQDPVHFICHAADEYLYSLNEPYKTIASKLFQSISSEKDHKDLIIKISGYKPKECCNESN